LILRKIKRHYDPKTKSETGISVDLTLKNDLKIFWLFLKINLMKTKDIHILLVEDNEGDILLAIEALKEARVRNRITVMNDGEKALEFLFGVEGNEQNDTPDIILLDMNLPKIDGLEVLAKIKANNRLKVIPVVMLTTSTSETHVMNAYKNNVNCYINKPLDLEEFNDVVKIIEQFWLNTVKLPAH
jgi:chemotaxis family two-component system response regulator Rcp1